MISRAYVPSRCPERDLARLCARFPVTASDPGISCIRCEGGTCALVAARDHLALVVRAGDAVQLARCQALLGRELPDAGKITWEQRRA